MQKRDNLTQSCFQTILIILQSNFFKHSGGVIGLQSLNCPPPQNPFGEALVLFQLLKEMLVGDSQEGSICKFSGS